MSRYELLGFIFVRKGLNPLLRIAGIVVVVVVVADRTLLAREGDVVGVVGVVGAAEQEVIRAVLAVPLLSNNCPLCEKRV